MRVKYINEVTFNKFFLFLSEQDDIYVQSKRKTKKFLEVIVWMAKSGAPWRMLPCEYGKWNSVFKRFSDWAKKKIWERMLTHFAQDADLEYVMMDATITRAHVSAVGYGDQDTQGLGRCAGGFSSKIHALVDALGNLLKIIVTPGQQHEMTQAKPLLENIENTSVLGDKAYFCQEFFDYLISKNCTSIIPPRSNSKIKHDYDKHIYKERHAIECFFAKMKCYRHVAFRFDKSIRSFVSFISFVGVCIWLR